MERRGFLDGAKFVSISMENGKFFAKVDRSPSGRQRALRRTRRYA